MPENRKAQTSAGKPAVTMDYNTPVLAVLIGALVGGASSVFLWMLDLSGRAFSADGLSSLGIPADIHFVLLPLMPMFGGLIVGAICRFIPRAVEENGVHAVIHSIARKDSKIGGGTILVCAANSAVTIGSGGAAGRHGPMVQIGSAIGSRLGQLFSQPPERLRIFVGCGASAGIAATFNAPLFGILFTLEVILRDYRLHTFSPIAISAVLGAMISRSLEGNQPIFQISIAEWANYGEIVFYILLGAVCGLVAALFIKVYFRTEHFFDECPIPPGLRPALGGLLVGVLSVAAPQILGSGYDFMQQALNEELFWGWALGLVVLKIFATSATLGSRGLGGILAPSLFMGLLTGGACGTAIHALFPELAAETYAIVGMGAVAGAVMQAPLTNVMMLVEFTGGYSLILPALTACVVASHTMRLFQKNSIFLEKLLALGIQIRRGGKHS
ncbi:MAG: chloride channel protein [Nitrospinales bacterium]